MANVLNSLLINCANNGDPLHLQRAIDLGANVNYTEPYCKWTPLHYAVNSGSLECVKILIKFGADIDKKDTQGNSPLDMSAETSTDSSPAVRQCLLIELAKRLIENVRFMSFKKNAKSVAESMESDYPELEAPHILLLVKYAWILHEQESEDTMIRMILFQR